MEMCCPCLTHVFDSGVGQNHHSKLIWTHTGAWWVSSWHLCTCVCLGGYVNWVPCPNQWWWPQQRRIWTHFQQPLGPLSINNWPLQSAAVVVEHFHCYCHHSYTCPACPSAQSCWHGNWFVLNGVTSVTAPAQPDSETPSFPTARVRTARSALVRAQPLNVQAFMIHRNHQNQHTKWTKWKFTSCRRFDSGMNPVLRLWPGKCAALHRLAASTCVNAPWLWPLTCRVSCRKPDLVSRTSGQTGN